MNKTILIFIFVFFITLLSVNAYVSGTNLWFEALLKDNVGTSCSNLSLNGSDVSCGSSGAYMEGSGSHKSIIPVITVPDLDTNTNNISIRFSTNASAGTIDNGYIFGLSRSNDTDYTNQKFLLIPVSGNGPDFRLYNSQAGGSVCDDGSAKTVVTVGGYWFNITLKFYTNSSFEIYINETLTCYLSDINLGLTQAARKGNVTQIIFGNYLTGTGAITAGYQNMLGWNGTELQTESADTSFPSIFTSVNATTVGVGTVLNFSANLSDETALSTGNITYNISGVITYLNFTLSGTSDKISNVTKLTEVGVINFTAYAEDSSGNTNQSSILVTVIPTLNLTILFPTNTTYYDVTSVDLNWTSNNKNLNTIVYSLDGASNISLFNDGLCYQESANESDQTGMDGSCGLNYGGNYDFDVPISGNEKNLIDGDYTTCYVEASGGIVYMNYTKPLNALSSSLWRINDSGVDINLSTPIGCWNYSNSKLALRLFNIGPLSLDGNTLISTPGGNIKIKYINKGDIIYSFNEEEELEEDKVIDTTKHFFFGRIYEITTEHNKLRITSNHRVFIGKDYKFVSDLEEGDILLNKNLKPEKILKIKKRLYFNFVYDLTVDKNKNFFANNLLVHNTVLGENWQCYNGTSSSWVSLREHGANPNSACDEAIWWNVTTSSNTTLTGLSVGQHNLTIYANDSYSQTNVQYISFNVSDNIPIVNTSTNITTSYILSTDVINISANITDNIGLSFCQIINNQSGYNVFSNYSLSGTTDKCSEAITITASASTVINFTVRVNDTSNNFYTNDTFIYEVIDKMNITILFPQNGSSYSSSSLDLNWTSNKDVLTIYYSLNNGANISLFNADFCYQESANETNQTGVDGDCGLDYGGVYQIDPFSEGLNQCHGTDSYINDSIDGDYSTFDRFENCKIMANWSLPSQSVLNFLTRIKAATVTVSTIDLECYNHSSSSYISLSSEVDGEFNYTDDSCLPSDTTLPLSFIISGSNLHIGGPQLFDQAIWWNVTTSSNTTLTSLSAGDYNLTLYANDSFGTFDSKTISFTITKSDSCTAPESGDWTISDNCTLDSPQNVPADLIFDDDAPLEVVISSSLTFTGSDQHIVIHSPTTIDIRSGGSLRGG